ncbi:MAG TPA: helix-turn-helix transcriptional regulator [Caulobacteraceae bacterium]|jgi:transcriptional regulator with XRE-family HTH domain|nr:helix-turn-helix transcriptional regulator [Caulobacteraceae bacterium]
MRADIETRKTVARTDVQARKQTASYAEEAIVVEAQAMLHCVMEEKQVSRSDLAKAMGVSRARVTQLFSDDAPNFTLRFLARAFHALGEKVEFTCEVHKKFEMRRQILASFEAAKQIGSGSSWSLGDWKHSDHGQLNDNDPLGVDFEVAAGSSSGRSEALVAHALGKIQRRRAA